MKILKTNKYCTCGTANISFVGLNVDSYKCSKKCIASELSVKWQDIKSWIEKNWTAGVFCTLVDGQPVVEIRLDTAMLINNVVRNLCGNYDTRYISIWQVDNFAFVVEKK